MSFYTKIEHICKDHNITPSKLCKELGLSNSTATQWKKGAIPTEKNILLIADYFNISKEELLSNISLEWQFTNRSYVTWKYGNILGLCLRQGITIKELITILDISPEEMKEIETNPNYRASEQTIQKIIQYFKVSRQEFESGTIFMEVDNYYKTLETIEQAYWKAPTYIKKSILKLLDIEN